MKMTTRLQGVWGTRLWTSLLVLLAFAAGIHWQNRGNALLDLEDARPALKESVPSNNWPSVVGPRNVNTGPDVVGVVADFSPVEAILVGCSELIIYHRPVFVEIARALSEADVPMIALVSDGRQRILCEQAIKQAGIDATKVHVVELPLNTMWVRDYGPIFVERDDHTIGIVDASYTAGVDHVEERWRDDELPIVLSEALKLSLRQIPLRLAGGNLLSNGEGVLLSSTELIFNNRSRGYTVKKIANHLKYYFSVGQWVFLKPADGDATRHVDMFITFLKPNVVVVSQADAGADRANAAILNEAAGFLGDIITSSGPMRVYRIPQPPRKEGRFRSYTNIIMANSVVLVPVFSDVDPKLQEAALDIYRKLLPERKIIGINADSLETGRGLLRCISIGIPEGVDWRKVLTWDMDADED